MKTKKILKRLGLALVIVAFLAPFPVPYLSILDTELVGEGTFISHCSEWIPTSCVTRTGRIHEQVNHFKYQNEMHNRQEVLDMEATDNSSLSNERLKAGQYIYVYAVGPNRWTAATTVKGDLRGVFFLRVFIEISVRLVLLSLTLFSLAFPGSSCGGGKLGPGTATLLMR